jgi:hypothetical protein
MRVEYDNDVIYREIMSEILRTDGNYNVTTIIENVHFLVSPWRSQLWNHG